MDTPIQMSKDKPVVLTADNYTNKKRAFRFSIVNPKILGMITVLVLLVGGVGAGVYLIQRPQQTTTQATISTVDLNFQPSQTNVEAGSKFDIDISAGANENKITSVKLTVTYDPAFLELESITPKQFLPKVLLEPSIASGSAMVSLGTDGNTGITGSGILASLSFRSLGKSPGSTQIKIDSEKTQINLLDNSSKATTNLGTAQILITPGTEITNETASIITETEDTTPIPDLETETATSSGGIAFDFNNDSQINAVDLSILYSGWGTPDTDLQKKADVNGDGVVNGIDYSQFLPKYKL